LINRAKTIVGKAKTKLKKARKMKYLNSKKTKIIMPVVCVISGCTSKHKVGKSGSKKTQKLKKKQITFHRLGYYTPIAKSLDKIRHFISATIECKH
jgi:hypothetical protein